jgi:hypothetical protein
MALDATGFIIYLVCILYIQSDDMSDNATINLRLPNDLKRAFEDACARNDQTASQVIRAMMREYVKKNAQGDLLKGSK